MGIFATDPGDFWSGLTYCDSLLDGIAAADFRSLFRDELAADIDVREDESERMLSARAI